MNLPPSWVDHLVARGHEAVHWRDVGAPNASDDAIVDWAARHGCMVLTADLDFGGMVATLGSRGPGIVQLRTGSTDPAVVGDRVARAVDRVGADLTSGAILTIASGHVRLRPPSPTQMDEL